MVYVCFNFYSGFVLNIRIIIDDIDEIVFWSESFVLLSSVLIEVLNMVYVDGSGVRNGINKVMDI